MSIIDTLITNRGSGSYYNTSDLNRVGEAVQYIADRLRQCGYSAAVAPKTNWVMADIPTKAQMERYLLDVSTIRTALEAGPVPPAPRDMDDLTVDEANNIERILLAVEDALNRIAAAWYYSGDLYSGEV